MKLVPLILYKWSTDSIAWLSCTEMKKRHLIKFWNGILQRKDLVGNLKKEMDR